MFYLFHLFSTNRHSLEKARILVDLVQKRELLKRDLVLRASEQQELLDARAESAAESAGSGQRRRK